MKKINMSVRNAFANLAHVKKGTLIESKKNKAKANRREWRKSLGEMLQIRITKAAC